MEDGVPVKGFVYRRKQFFSSFENLLDSSAEKETKVTLVASSLSAGPSGRDKRWRLSNADVSFQQKVVTFEQYTKKPERTRQDSNTSNVSVNVSLKGSEKRKESSSSIEKWSSMPVLDDQVISLANSNKSCSVEPEKDINGNTSIEGNNVPSAVAANGCNGFSDVDAGVDNTTAEKQEEETKENKPHWTTVFSQRLNQIRHRFENKSRSDYQKSFGNGSRRNFCRGSVDNLDSLEKPVANTNLKNTKEMAKSCVDLYNSKLPGQSTFRRNVVQTSSSTTYKQTQNWLEKNLVLIVKDNPDNICKETAKNTAKENSMNVAKMKQNLKMAASGRPNLTDSEKAELANNAYLAKWGPNGSLAPDILQHENDGILFSYQIFAGQIKEPVRSNDVVAQRITDSQDLVKEIKIIDEVNGQDVADVDVDVDIKISSAVPPVMVPAEGFTADEKVKERATLKDWDPVSSQN